MSILIRVRSTDNYLSIYMGAYLFGSPVYQLAVSAVLSSSTYIS